MCANQRQEQPSRDADADNCESFAHYEPQHSGRTRTQRQPDSQFTGAAGNLVRHHSVKTQAGKAESDTAENRSQPGNKPLLRQVVAYLLGQRINSPDRQTRIDIANRLSDLGNELARRTQSVYIEALDINDILSQ